MKTIKIALISIIIVQVVVIAASLAYVAKVNYEIQSNPQFILS